MDPRARSAPAISTESLLISNRSSRLSAALISMGMMVLPPFFVSLPFKLLLFILVDGWHLVVGSLVKSFHG